jgi:protein-S-isoprenylcysteine O-methyltransferase Ste14
VTVLAAVLFGSAGRVNIPAFWLYLAVVTAACAAPFFVVDPALMEERVRPGGKSQNAVYALVLLWPIAHWGVAGLDRGRFQWSDNVPPGLAFAALVVFAASFALVMWAAHANTFASSVLRIQEERGHRVIATGPYAFVRHPMYLAGIVITVASGPALVSWLAALIAVPGALLLWWRTRSEDRVLRTGLPGYREYAQQVPARLVPGLW